MLRGRDFVEKKLDIFTTRDLHFNKLCSSNLAQTSAYYNSKTGKGTQDRILCAGEETEDGRGFAFLITGNMAGHAYELTHHGNYWFENIVANPTEQDITITVGLEDKRVTKFNAKGYVTVYVGEKKLFGKNPVDQAGLLGGKLYCLQIENYLCRTITTNSGRGGYRSRGVAGRQLAVYSKRACLRKL